MRTKPSTLVSLIALLGLLLFVFLFRLAEIPIHIWDEARLANNALHMHVHGNYWVTFYEGAPDMWNTKPPLMIWLQVLGMKLLGINEWAVRLPAALASLLTGLTLWLFCLEQFKKPLPGLLAGIVFATTYGYVYIHAGRTGDYDALMVLFTTLYCLSIYQYATSRSNRWIYVFWAFLTAAALTKGVAGLLLTPGLVFFLLSRKEIKSLLLNRALYNGGLFFLAITLGYYLLREHFNPGYLHAVYQNELGGRYLSTLEDHNHPFWFYLQNLHNWRYPFWVYFLLPAFMIGFLHKEKLVKSLTWFNTLVTIPYLFIISAAGTKLEWYDLPLFPFFALQIALLLYYGFQYIQKKLFAHRSINKTITATALFTAIFFIPFLSIYNYIVHFREQPWNVEPHKQGYFLQQAIRQNKNLDKYVFCYEGYNGQLAFYVQKLQLEKVNVHLTNSPEWLKEGDHVVVSQPSLEQQVLKTYTVKKTGEQFGCTEYLVVSKL